MSNTINTISLETAISWAKKWRKKEGTYNNHYKVKAMFIPKDDITALLSKEIDGVRAYLGVDENDVEKLILVGTKLKEGTDIYEDLLPGSTNTYAEIYDFTRPCPHMCDPKSVLNTLE